MRVCGDVLPWYKCDVLQEKAWLSVGIMGLSVKSGAVVYVDMGHINQARSSSGVWKAWEAQSFWVDTALAYLMPE